MTDSEKVTAYIQKHEKWSDELDTLRKIFTATELEEEVKWGSPTYTLNRKLVAGFAAFKNHYAIWFHQGVFLKDTQKVLSNAQEGKTKALRQWRFEKGNEIPKEMVSEYLEEAIGNSLAGKEWKPVRKKSVSLPPLLEETLKNNPELKSAFSLLTPGRQREYAEYIGSAKKEETRQRRIEKAIPNILNRIGLNDKYQKC